ncbi:MAG TPA: 5-dehydro-4-deoxy-D-glucuronate isomerase [Candidatus Acidoferrales bacterium]|nr:5-dehydro-4-deoxy-D-glucuronate isomerase [Candidatus Acidoferrales bacterium]
MEVRYAPDVKSYKKLSTEELRNAFLMENLFQDGSIQTLYFDLDRAIVGGAVPLKKSLPLLSSKQEMASQYFAERREIGIFNIGGSGKVKVDGKEFLLEFKDAVYVGRGAREVSFSSSHHKKPARFYFVSYPAHSSYPSAFIKFGKIYSTRTGNKLDANERTINRCIHADGIKSSQLVMGLTDLSEGSVWNTMPAHTHRRRTEIYLYFGLDGDSVVFHMMGEPDETRHLIVRDKQAVISPSWSVHTGVGTKSYSFIWAMGGENQDYEDMDAVKMLDLK